MPKNSKPPTLEPSFLRPRRPGLGSLRHSPNSICPKCRKSMKAASHYIPLHPTIYIYIFHYIRLHGNSITFRYIPLHYIALLSIILHYLNCITLHCIPLHSRKCHCIAFHYITVQHNALHLHYITLHYNPSYYVALLGIELNYTAVHHRISLHIQVHCSTLHYITFRFLALHFMTFYTRYISLHYIYPVNYIPLHYITL